MISTQHRPAHRGFSLIEVAIALVIFVVGALAIIKIFPGALKVIGNNGNQQIATNLNRDVKVRLETDGSVPSATFNVALNNDGTVHWTTANNADHSEDYVAAAIPSNLNLGVIGNRGDIPASIIGIPRINFTLPTTADINAQSNNSALSRFRGILGEQAKVINIGGLPYATTQFPISIQGTGTTQTPLAPTISQEYVVQNARIDKDKNVTFADATTDINGQQVRLDDSTNAEVGVKNNLPIGSMLYVSYRYFDNNAKVWGVREEAFPVKTALVLSTTSSGAVKVSPPTTTRGSYANYVAANAATTGTVAEAIDVRVKQYLGTGTFGTGSNIEQITYARCGLVKLPALVPPMTYSNEVSVDYVADWSWLMQKGNPLISSDASGNRQLALGAPFIEDQEPVGIYSLLLDTSSVPPSLSASQYGTSSPAPTGGLVAPTEDELRTSKVTFSATSDSTKARVAYRTRDSWVQQLSVAASTYKPYALVGNPPTNPVEPWRDYYLGGDNYLYFHASEAGKTISISYVTTDSVNPIVERPFVIDQQIIDAPTAAGVTSDFAASGKVSRVLLTNYAGDILPVANLVSIQGVRGTSVTVRTAYINGDRYAQTLLTSNRGTN